MFFSFLSSWKDKCIRVAFLSLWGNYVLYTLQLWFWVICLISSHRQSVNRKGGGGDGLWGRGSESVGEDDAVPGLVGRGHSSAALYHEKGQLRTGQAASSRYPVTEMRRNCERPDFGLIFLWAVQMGRFERLGTLVDWSAADPCRLQTAFTGLRGMKTAALRILLTMADRIVHILSLYHV